MNNLKTTGMSLNVRDDTNSSNIITTSKHHNISALELEMLFDFSVIEVVFDGVVDIDVGVWVSDCSAVVGNDVWNFIRADSLSLNFA